jgi:hypothetical protein
MAGLLRAYLAEQAGQGFEYGTHDCALFCIHWLDRVTGRNGAAQWAGRYTDEASCEAFIRAGGGFEKIATAFLAGTYGIYETENETPGNIVFAATPGGAAMGVRTGATIAMRAKTGLIITSRVGVVAEWGPVCRQ